MVPMICSGLVLASFVGVVLWIMSMRREAELGRKGMSRHDLALKAAVEAYAVRRGASVTFDGLAMHVKGPRGEGKKTMHALKIMCPLGAEAKWDLSIGFTLREFIPDAFDESFAKAAASDLAKIAPQVAALSDEELRARLRVKVVSTRSPSEGLATCARPLSKRFELRVVLDGFELNGLPNATRARLAESDEALMQHAFSQTLSTPPRAEDGAVLGASAHVWLSRSAEIFGAVPHVIVAEGDGLRWMPATRERSEERLVALARASMETGPMKGAMWGWDGHALHESTVVMHTIIGPTTPDYTLTLPLSMHPLLGIQASADGTFGVKRPR